MRILHLFDHSLPMQSGYSFRSRAILREQRRRGWETAHVTTPRHTAEGPKDETVDGLTFHRAERPTRAESATPVLRELAEVSRSAKKLIDIGDAFEPDLIHAHSPVLTAMAAERAARALRVPWIYEIRAFWEDAAAANHTGNAGSLRHRATHWLESRAIRNADGIATICDGLYQDIIARRGDTKRVVQIPNAVNAEDFAPRPCDDALKTELGLEGRDVIGFLGSFYPYEGVDLLIDAMPAILSQHPNAGLLLVGGGPMADDLAARAAQSPACEAIVMTGRVPHTDIDRYYSVVDILAFPRRPIRLTELVTPLKPLEAMALKKIVVASDVGGHRELIRDGETGFLFAAGGGQAVSEAVCAALASRENWPDMQTAGRQFVENERTWVQSINGYETLFDRLGLQ
ncbi:MAG: TIGR04063 family PEP-CTERM/XrtA system glycosyltransferase [Pseudomonadota bacterium]